MTPPEGRSAPAAKVVVATTVALAFISFWRAAAIVLSDMASSAFYAGGIAERAIGASAPWFILGVMFFAFAVRSVYLESCGMFVRGGVYVVVRDSMGPFMARLSVSALIFDFVLTGPISTVSAGHYLARLLNEIGESMQLGYHVTPNGFAMVFGTLVTAYFWWTNTKGIRESSGKALRIMQITTVMVVLFLLWCPLTLLVRGPAQTPPAPLPRHLDFSPEAVGWLEGTFLPGIGAIGLVIAFGHSILSMSGFETLAQVYREIAAPKMRNLRRAANLVCLYALFSTGVITVFAGFIIPDAARHNYTDNLLGGLAMHLAGPQALTLLFHVFVVLVGTLILSGAANTALIGANGILNRIAEDGVLMDWFRKPHRRFGTTYRMINTVALLQLFTILYSRGDVYLLGEAYAFGVVWSFFMKSLGVLFLRFQRHDQEYKTPLNPRVGGREIPLGLIAITLVLLVVAVGNLLTKKLATVYGVSFTAALFVVFTISERVNARKRHEHAQALEVFNLEHQPEVDRHSIEARPGCVLVAARDYHQMAHLRAVLAKTNVLRHDIVVMTVRPAQTGGEYDLAEDQIFTDYERELFTRVVALAEKEGKHVDLLVVPGVNPFDAMVQTAARLQAARLVTGVSPKMESRELARRIGLAWERLPEPRHPFSLEVIAPNRRSIYVNLGPHPPRLWPEDVSRVHQLWLQLAEKEGFGAKLHHRDVVGVALRRLERDFEGERRAEVLEDLARELRPD